MLSLWHSLVISFSFMVLNTIYRSKIPIYLFLVKIIFFITDSLLYPLPAWYLYFQVYYISQISMVLKEDSYWSSKNLPTGSVLHHFTANLSSQLLMSKNLESSHSWLSPFYTCPHSIHEKIKINIEFAFPLVLAIIISCLHHCHCLLIDQLLPVLTYNQSPINTVMRLVL